MKANKVSRQAIWCIALAVTALSFAGAAMASTTLLPVKKPKKIFSSSIETVAAADITLPTRKPGTEKTGMIAEVTEAMATAMAAIQPAAGSLARAVASDTPSARLSGKDSARYARIFALQDEGKLEAADREIAALGDQRLMGHVLAQRYQGTHYVTSYDELSTWMAQYADHPDAREIHALALRKRPASATVRLASPKTKTGIMGQQDFDTRQTGVSYLKEKKFNGTQRAAIRTISHRLSDNSPTSASEYLEAHQDIFNAAAYDALRAKIAQSWFYNGKADLAYTYAAQSADRSGREVPVAGWIAGLGAWKQGDYKSAAKYFEIAAASKRSSAWLASAGGYWAARAHLRARNPRSVSKWLNHAATYPRTFYGIIALKALGREYARFNWDAPELDNEHIKALAGHNAGRRALALVDAGAVEQASEELGQINPGRDKVLREAVIALSVEANLPQAALRFGSAFKDEDGNPYDTALYPDTSWQPHDGFAVDRALVYAFIRQESQFNPDVSNKSSGATGLMQLMPATAQHVSGQRMSRDDLRDPATNMALGQKYLKELLGDRRVDGNLFKLAVAYNAGPGKLTRWEKETSYEDDPLLFIESIPVAETRVFVERVMTNFWIYRLKYGQKTETLDHVASGAWPRYTAQDQRRGVTFADAARVLKR